MVEHGTSIMVNVRRGPRELEAQTSIKRGYLNLIHAREAFARLAVVVDKTAGPRERAAMDLVLTHVTAALGDG